MSDKEEMFGGNERLAEVVRDIELREVLHTDSVLDCLWNEQDRFPDWLLDYLLPYNGYLPQVCRRFKWHWPEDERRKCACQERLYAAVTPHLWGVLVEANPLVAISSRALNTGGHGGREWHALGPDGVQQLLEEHRQQFRAMYAMNLNIMMLAGGMSLIRYTI